MLHEFHGKPSTVANLEEMGEIVCQLLSEADAYDDPRFFAGVFYLQYLMEHPNFKKKGNIAKIVSGFTSIIVS
jgi:hypothetical protein